MAILTIVEIIEHAIFEAQSRGMDINSIRIDLESAKTIWAYFNKINVGTVFDSRADNYYKGYRLYIDGNSHTKNKFYLEIE